MVLWLTGPMRGRRGAPGRLPLQPQVAGLRDLEECPAGLGTGSELPPQGGFLAPQSGAAPGTPGLCAQAGLCLQGLATSTLHFTEPVPRRGVWSDCRTAAASCSPPRPTRWRQPGPSPGEGAGCVMDRLGRSAHPTLLQLHGSVMSRTWPAQDTTCWEEVPNQALGGANAQQPAGPRWPGLVPAPAPLAWSTPRSPAGYMA